MKHIKALTLMLLIVLVCLIANCHKKDEDEVTTPKQSYAAGGIFKEISNGSTYNFRGVAVFGPMIPHVTINGDTIPFDLNISSGEGTGTYWDEEPVVNGNTYNLKVDFHEFGKLNATAKLPGTFTITPSGSYTLPLNSGFNATWTSSAGADWYLVDFELNYEYYYGGYGYYFYFDTSFITTSNSFSLSSNILFPSPIDWVTYSWGTFSVAAVNGPIPQPGSYGNVSGEGYGFFLGAYFPQETDIHIQGTLYQNKENPKPRYKALFNALQKLIPKQ